MLKQLGIPLVWILLSGVLIAPIASIPAFAVDTTTTTITSSQNPSTLGQQVNFTAAVTPSNATGIMIFNDTSTNPPTILDASVISGGLATFSISSLSAGTHNIVAIYVGDANNLPSTSDVLVQTVDKIGTITTITSSINPSVFGQSVNFTATVAPVSGSLTPIGTIQFLVDGITTGSPVTLVGNQASFVLPSLSTGTHSISAIYSGDTIFDASTGVLTQTILQIGTTISLTSSQNQSTIGQPVTFTASILPISATGTVQFNDTSTTPTTILGTSTLSGGTASFSTSLLTTGSHTIIAKYLGDINNIPSTSNIITQTVNSISASTTSLSSNATSIISGHSITFTAKVSPSSANGTIQFKVNGTNLGSPITLSGGQAIFSTSSLPLGSDIISASYSGSNIINPSNSNSVTITVSSISQGVMVEEINGNGNLGKGNNFEFNIDSKNGTTFTGHLNYHDKTAHFNLHSTQITSLSVDSSMTNVFIMGQAKTKENPHDNDTAMILTFSVSITVSDKKGKHDPFSIIVTNSTGKIIYQKSGTANGHIEIHKLKVKNEHSDDKNDQKNINKNNHKNNEKNSNQNNKEDD